MAGTAQAACSRPCEPGLRSASEEEPSTHTHTIDYDIQENQEVEDEKAGVLDVHTAGPEDGDTELVNPLDVVFDAVGAEKLGTTERELCSQLRGQIDRSEVEAAVGAWMELGVFEMTCRGRLRLVERLAGCAGELLRGQPAVRGSMR